MTIHVNIGEAKTRLSQLIAAALRGEEVVIDRDGTPQVRLVPTNVELTAAQIADRAARRRAAFGMWKDEFAGWTNESYLQPSMTDEEVEERWQRKFAAD